MNKSGKDIKELLLKSGVRPSYHRIRIYDDLLRKNDHPTAEEIFLRMSSELPTLSRTTVYNTVKALRDAGLIRALFVEDQEARYDAVTELHGHFRCSECGKITDFPVQVLTPMPDILAGCHVAEQGFYLKGVCRRCNNGWQASGKQNYVCNQQATPS